MSGDETGGMGARRDGPLKSRVAGGMAWLAAGRLLVNLLAFAGTIVLARLLTPDDFGLVAIATTLLAIVSAVTELSMAQALVHRRDLHDDHLHAAWTLNAARGLLVGLLFCALAQPVASLYGEPRLVAVMVALGLSVVVNGLANPKMALFARDLVFRQEFALNVAGKAAAFTVSVAVAYATRSHWALVMGVVASQTVTIALSYRFVPYRPRFGLKRARDLWSFSVWLSLSQVVNTVNWKSDQLFVAGFLGTAPLGFYTVGDNLAAMPTREAAAPLMRVLFPAFSWLRDQPERLREAYRSAQGMVSVVALPVAVGSALVAEPLVAVTMGTKWLPSVPVIQVLSCVFGLQTLASAARPLAMGGGHTALLFRRDVLGLVIRLPSIVAGLALGGLHGLILARAFTGTVGLAINMQMVSRIAGLSVWRQIGDNARTLLAVGAMAAAVLGADAAARDALAAAHLPHDPALALGRVALMVAVGAAAYPLALALAWHASGRPAGPEREIALVLDRLRTRLRARPA